MPRRIGWSVVCVLASGLLFGEAIADRAGQVIAQVEESTTSQQEALERALEKSPEEAQAALRKAIERAERGNEASVEALRKTLARMRNPEDFAEGGRAWQSAAEALLRAAGRNAQTLEKIRAAFPKGEAPQEGRPIAAEGRHGDVLRLVDEATLSQVRVLEGLLEELPEEAGDAVLKAKQETLAGNRAALAALEMALDGLDEEGASLARALAGETIESARQKHVEVLEEVYGKVPEQAKPAIERALAASGRSRGVPTSIDIPGRAAGRGRSGRPDVERPSRPQIPAGAGRPSIPVTIPARGR